MAITNPDANNAGLPFTGAGGSVLMNNACAPNDLIHAVVSLLNASSNAPPTLSDNVNSGNYTLIGTPFFDATNGFLLAHYYKVANATGTPTIATGSVAAAGAGAGGKVAASRYTGFVGTPTLDVALALGANATNADPAGQALVTTHTPELLVGASCQESGSLSGGNTWTSNAASASSALFYSYKVETGAIGTSDTWSYTWSASAVWEILNAGFFGSSGGTGAALAGAASDTTSATGALTAPAAPFAPILLNSASHAGGSTQLNMGSGPNTGTGDSLDVAFPKIIQDMDDLNTMLAQLYPVRSIQIPITGFDIAVPAGVTQLILNPAGTLATGTVTLPQNPGDNQPFSVMTSQTITALTVDTADGTTLNGAPTTLAANAGAKWRFVASLNTWFREQ